VYLKSCVFGIVPIEVLNSGVHHIDDYLDLMAAMGVPQETLITIDEERRMLIDEVERRAALYGGFDIGEATKKAFRDDE